MDKCKEQLESLIEICEKQIKTIKVLSDYTLTDTHLKPQLDVIKKAKEFLTENFDKEQEKVYRSCLNRE